MCIFEEFRYGKHVGAGIHHDEEEHSRQVKPGNVGIVLHNFVQQVGHLLD